MSRFVVNCVKYQNIIRIYKYIVVVSQKFGVTSWNTSKTSVLNCIVCFAFKSAKYEFRKVLVIINFTAIRKAATMKFIIAFYGRIFPVWYYQRSVNK